MSGESDGDCGYDAEGSGPRSEFLERAGVSPGRCVGLSQVHGNRVIAVGRQHAGAGALSREGAEEADGLVTNTPGLGLLIGAADCVPVLLYAPESGVIGALHAGREGTYLNIAGFGVAKMQGEYGVLPNAIHAVIGPSICWKHYEVSEELADRFRKVGLPTEGRCLDLWQANRKQLIAAGVPKGQIVVSGRCTFEDSGFHSFRREGTRKRNLAVIALPE